MKRLLTGILALLTVFSMLPTAMLGAFAADNRKEAEPVKLRVGSYNIHNGSDMKHDFSILAEEILRARLDVIGLQEVDRGTNRSKKQDTVEVLVKALKEMTGSDSWYGYFTLATGMDGGQYGTAIISKYELKNTETVKLPHTSGYEQRSYGHAEITVGGRTVHLYNTHLEWPNANDRAKQIVVMGEEISKRDCAILTGDLNIGARREYQPKFPLCNFANGGDDDHTFMTLEDGAIDNIISTKNTILRKNSGMIKTSSSDHNLLWAELCIKPEANFRAEDGKIYYYADGETAPAKGKVTIDGNTMYFDETTGAMRTGTVQDGEKTVTTEEFKAAGLTLSRAPRPKDDVAPEQRTLHKEVTGTKITGFNGKDYTKELTDNDYGTNIDYTFHWYEKPEDFGWTIENGTLVIGGVGTVDLAEGESSYPWARFADSITAVEVLPDSVTAIGDGAFKGLNKVARITVGNGVETVGDHAFDTGSGALTLLLPEGLSSLGGSLCDCENVRIVLNGITGEDFTALLGEENENLKKVTPEVNTVTEMTVEAKGNGFANEKGRTILSMILKDKDGKPLTLPEDCTWHLIFTDGERQTEPTEYCSAAMKLSCMKPCFTDPSQDLYCFDVCNAEGDNQFIPHFDSTYYVRVEIYSGDGKPVYSGKSGWKDFLFLEEPIYDEFNTVPTYSSVENWLEVDLQKKTPVSRISVGFRQASGRSYRWQAYGTDDPTLPLCMWTPLGGQYGSAPSTGSFTVNVAKNEQGEYPSYRYVRIYGSHNSANWTIHFAEVHISTPGVTMTEVLPRKITQAEGQNVTAAMTDGLYYESYPNELHWYDKPNGPVWTVDGDRLVIGGKGTVKAPFGWNSLPVRNRVKEVVVLSGTVSAIESGAFAALGGVKTVTVGEGVTALGANLLSPFAEDLTVSLPSTLEKADPAAAAGCPGLTKVILNGKSASDYTELLGSADLPADVEIVENETVRGLTVEPVIDGDNKGFATKDGKTTLTLTLKEGESPFTAGENAGFALAFEDGEKTYEAEDWKSSTVKYMKATLLREESDPEKGRYCFLLLDSGDETIGKDDFVPGTGRTYEVTVEVYGEDGLLDAAGKSARKKFFNDRKPAAANENYAHAYASPINYVTIDLGKPVNISGLHVAVLGNYADRYTHWDAYATNDPGLPLSLWTPIAKKDDNVTNAEDRDNRRLYEVAPDENGEYGAYRYVRICGAFDNKFWSILFTELQVFAVDGEVKCPVGDVTANMIVNMQDTTALLGHLSDPEANPIAGNGDVNGDGKLTGKDVSRLLQILENL